jgi:hypothetical protein
MDKPAASSVLQAMAEAYPDRVDLGLLAMVLGCERSALDAALGELTAAGLAQDDSDERSMSHAPTITESGMAVACGHAPSWESAPDAVQRLQADALRQLMCQRVSASGLQPRMRRELRESIAGVAGDSLLSAAKIWAYRPVADWAALIQALRCPAPT